MSASMPSLAFSQAQWVWTDPPGDLRWCAARFRGRFSVETACRLVCHVSADSRYLLFLDGVLLGRGPARSDLRHYVYETYPLALGAGNHVLAAFVVSFQNGLGPIAEVHDRPGLLLELQDTGGRVVLATGTDGWRVQLDQAVRPAAVQLPLPAYYGVGTSEVVDGSLIPKGWEQPGFDDSGWAAPAAAGESSPRGGYFQTRFPHVEDRRQLVARDLPHLREEPRQFSGTGSLFPLTVPAGGRREILLDAGEYADGFPLLTTEGGAGGTVAIYYAEALTRNGQKGVRDAGDGGDVAGFCDRYHPGGGQETYMPLHWRAFRFVKLVVEAAAEPLTVRDFSYRMTGYPWERRAVFTVDGGPAELTQVQDVDFRTLARCTSETFMDCPYYEQLQYVGDTRLQALLSYVTTGDARLGARAVRLFDWSRIPEGLTQSRYPSNLEQIIPPFSLLWILMVEDLWRYAPGEGQTVASCLPGCRGVLEWFGTHLNPDGVLGGPLPWWNFVDWNRAWEWGVPPPARNGLPSATINLQFLAALQAYVRLHEGLGDTRESEFWQAQADMLADAILLTFWDPDALLLHEGPEPSWGYSQHAQAWGILADVIPRSALDRVVSSLEQDETLSPTTYYHTFYVAEALAKAGRLERLWEHWLAPWRTALDLHLTTWPEEPEPTRSDCHAWSAWPTYCFLTHVLGVRPGSPGFGSYEVAPRRVLGWDRVGGVVPTPSGLLRVTVDWTARGAPRIESVLEEG